MYKYKIAKYIYKLKNAPHYKKHLYQQKLKYYRSQQQSGGNVLHGGVETLEPRIIPEEEYVRAPIEETEEQRRIREIREQELQENIRRRHLRATIWNSTEFNKDSDKFNELRRQINTLTIWPGDKYKYILILFVIKELINIKNKDVIMKNVINQAKEYEKWIKQIEKFKKDNKISIRDRNNFVESFSYTIKPLFFVKKKIRQNGEEVEVDEPVDASDIFNIIRYTDVRLADKINEIIVIRDNRMRINTVNEITDINNHNTWINDIRNIGKHIIQIVPIYSEFSKKIDQVKELNKETKNWARRVVIFNIIALFHDYSLEQKQKIMNDTMILMGQYDGWVKQIDDIHNLSETYKKRLKAKIREFILYKDYSKLTLEQKQYNINTIIKLSKEYVKWINKIKDLKELELGEIQYFEGYISFAIIHQSEFSEEEKIQKIEKIIKLAKQYADFINQVNETTELRDEDKNVLKDKVRQIITSYVPVTQKLGIIDQYSKLIEYYKKVLDKINKLNIEATDKEDIIRELHSIINERTIVEAMKRIIKLDNNIETTEKCVKQRKKIRKLY